MSFYKFFYYNGVFALYSILFAFFNLGISGMFFALAFTIALLTYNETNKSTTAEKRKTFS